jgi:hypothetical protein
MGFRTSEAEGLTRAGRFRPASTCFETLVTAILPRVCYNASNGLGSSNDRFHSLEWISPRPSSRMGRNHTLHGFHAITTLNRTRKMSRIFFMMLLGAACGVVNAADESVLTLTGADGLQVVLSRADFQQLPRTTLEAVDHQQQKHRYTGVEFSQLLEKIEAPSGDSFRGHAVALVLAVDAADGYRAVYSLPECEKGAPRKIILADECDGKPLQGKAGPYQVIIEGESRHSRFVRMVTSLRILDSRSFSPTAP